jgi:hypothetical protein
VIYSGTVTEGTREQGQEVGGMSTRVAARLAWIVAALSVAMFVASAGLTALSLYGAPATEPSSTWGTVNDLVLFVPFLAFPLVGALIASRRPENPIGWICLTAGFFWMLLLLGESPSSLVPNSVALDALTQWTWVPPVGLLGIYMILLFRDGKLPSRKWRPLAWFSGAVMVLVSVALTLIPGRLDGHPGVRNPFGLEGHPMVAQALPGVIVLLPVCILASATSLIWRYRRSRGEVREQIKWVAFAASLVGVMYLISLVGGLFFAPEATQGSTGTPPFGDILLSAVLLSYAGVPIAVGFAVLKYRLYDIDIIINRTLVYGSLTATLVALYFVGIVVLQRLFVVLTGQQSTLAVVASTLLIAALFSPLRRGIQSFIDRRFYRRKYDAAKTLEAFSAKLRDETDLDALSDDLVGVVRETMQPDHVSLWLGPSRRFVEDTEEK